MGENFSKFLASEINENENKSLFNEDLIYGIRQEPLVYYIVRAFKALENKYLKLKDWKLITDESKFDSNKINPTFIKNKKNKKFLKRIPINKSRYDLLELTWECNTGEKKWIEKRSVLLYKLINKYYYLIDGNRYCPIYQLVDASVYNRKNYLTQKSQSSPIILKREFEEIKDVEGTVFKIQYIKICLSKQRINILLFFLALMGYENTLIFMQMNEIIRIETFRKYNKDEEYCFMSNSNLYIKVIKYFFDNDQFVRYMVTALLYIMEDCRYIDDLYNHDIWTAKLGALITKDDQEFEKKFYKGEGFKLTFHSFWDLGTKANLRVKSFNKGSTFAVLRWMLRNFNELKLKDNMDLANKRIRLGEQSEATLIRRLNQRKRKFFTDITTNKIKPYYITDLINMDQNFVIKTISGSKSTLIKYDDAVNDCDLFTALKFSLKGISSIGEKNSNAINILNRDIHPSYVGFIDLNATSNSDPGMSGTFVPMCKTYGKFFTLENEPESWDENFKNMYKNYFHKENLPIYKLNYFYNKEKASRKKLVQLDNIEDFINYDPYIGTKEFIDDPYKEKRKILKMKHLDYEGNPSIPFIDNTKKKTTRKRKKKNDRKKIKIRKLK